MFRNERAPDHRDVPRQKELLRDAFARMHPDVDDWLDELDRTPAFHFDTITQLRMDTWPRGRVRLVGDAGYCPGLVAGDGTSLAAVGAYVLARELARTDGDHERAFPASRLGVRAVVHGARLISVLPARPGRALLRHTAKSGAGSDFHGVVQLSRSERHAYSRSSDHTSPQGRRGPVHT